MDDATLRIDDGSTVELWRHDELAAVPGSEDDLSDLLGQVGLAVPVRAVLAPGLEWANVASRDGTYRASIPADVLRSGGWLIIGSRETPLAPEAGGPIRLVVADGDTLCWNVKDVGSIIATADKDPDSVPEDPPH